MILRLLGRRLAALPLMILGITLLVFLVLQAAPGDQASSALGEGASEAAKQQYRQDSGLNDPLFVQYFRFLGRLLQLDLDLLTEIAGAGLGKTLIAEGRIHTPAHARQALDAGAYAVVVGTAITHPASITGWFKTAVDA